MGGLQLPEAFQSLRQVDEGNRVARHHPVGMADGAVQLEVERDEPGGGNRGHAGHHDRQGLAHADGRFDVDAAVCGQRRDQFEMVGDGIEPAADQRDLGFHEAGRPVDQQPLGGPRGAGEHRDVGDARDQRERDERKRQRRDQRQPQGPAHQRRHREGGVRTVAQTRTLYVVRPPKAKGGLASRPHGAAGIRPPSEWPPASPCRRRGSRTAGNWPRSAWRRRARRCRRPSCPSRCSSG